MDFYQFWLCFVPLFVAVDAVGLLPLYLGLIEGSDRKRQKRVVITGGITALLVSVSFVLAGPPLMRYLGVQISDFQIAGGLLLFVFAMGGLLVGHGSSKSDDNDPETLGAVPIGVPLIAGPAVFTTSTLLADRHGWELTIIALAVNVLIACFLFWYAAPIARTLGNPGMKTISKLANMLLAAIAVMLIRTGVLSIIHSWPN